MAANLRHRRTEKLSGSADNDGAAVNEIPTSKWRNAFFIALSSTCALLFALVIGADILVDLDIEPQSFSLSNPPEYLDALAPNRALEKALRLFEGQIEGPECIAISKNGHIYTGVANGSVLHLYEDKIETLVECFGQPPCGGFVHEPTCGRPLGMRLLGDDHLVVVDAYHGLYKVNILTGETQQLVSSLNKINGQTPKFLNDLDIASDGNIYFTDSSTKWDRRHNRLDVMEAGAYGRLLSFNPNTQKISVLLAGLQFANGVQLSQNEEFVLVAETTLCRVIRYYLRGVKAGTSDIFADNLPGTPDNIRASGSHGYWVGFATIRRAGRFSGLDFMSNKPWLRRIAAKILSQETLMKIAGTKHGLIAELDSQGNIVRSLHDPDGVAIRAVSSVTENAQTGELYLGSYDAPYIGRVQIH